MLKDIIEERNKKYDELFGVAGSSGTFQGIIEQGKKAFISETAQIVAREVRGEWYLGKKIKAFGEDYVVVGLSQMIYDEDCEGEPEWKITKEIQEVAIALEYDYISFQKPSWHSVVELQSLEKELSAEVLSK